MLTRVCLFASLSSPTAKQWDKKGFLGLEKGSKNPTLIAMIYKGIHTF